MDNSEQQISKEKQILLKVRELFFRYGIKSLTMDDIAQNLGISKKTLYQVVSNKAELVDKIMDITIDERQHGMECAVCEGDNAIEEMLQIYRHHATMQKGINISVTFELQKFFPDSWQKLEIFRNNFILNSVRLNLEKGIKDGLYRSDMDVDVIARIYSYRILDLINIELFPPEQYSQQHLFHEMFLYHIHGVASAKGLKYLEEQVKIDF